MRRQILLIAAALLILMLPGCSKTGSLEIPEDTVSTETPVQPPPPEPEPVIPEVGSFLNGLPLDDQVKFRRPIAVMLDNQVKARPQAGLSEADVVIEAMAEGQITRYMAIFQSKDPQIIGPVRSARPYFIEKAMEYDAYYVHVGGSAQALSDVKKRGIADIDALREGRVTFWRKSHKKAPHNMYTSPEAIRNATAARKYKTEWDSIPQTFSNEDTPTGGTAFSQVGLHYKDPGKGDSTGYTPVFVVSQGDSRMMRSVNGKPHLDETTQEPLYAENLIIQNADHRVIDSEGRLDVDLVGDGTGFYCSAGEYWPITWTKKSPETPTVFSLVDGTPLMMKPGKLWVEIFPTKKTIEFK